MSPFSRSESSVSLPSLSSRSATPIRRKRFDDRAQTAVSLQLRAHASWSHELPHKSPSESVSKALNMVRWTEIKHVSKIVNLEEFTSTFGVPLCVELSPLYIAVGTSLGAVIGFNYHQEVIFMLHLHHQEDATFKSDVAVTAMAFSADSSYLSAGYMDGKIAVWDLSAPKSKLDGYSGILPYTVIRPISLESRFARNGQGHLIGVPVNSVQFVGSLQHHLVSSDVSGLVFFHYGFKKFLQKYNFSQKLLGQNDSNQTDQPEKYTIKDCLILPVGTSPQITDHIGLVAVMTSNILAIVSIRSLNNASSINPITHFKISKSKHVDIDDTPVSGSLSWYPCIERNNLISNAKLAYSWNNVLTVLELDNKSIPGNLMKVIGDLKDKDKGVPKLPIFKTARWNTSNPKDRVVNLAWLNSEILTALVKCSETTETKLYFLFYSNDVKATFIEVGVDNLDAQQITWSELQTQSKDQPLVFNNFHNSMRIFRHTLMTLVNSRSRSHKNILTGKLFKWADRLMGFLNQKDYLTALLAAKDYYSSENFGYLVLNGLPHTTIERHEVVRPFLVQIMTESVVPLFSDPGEGMDTDNTLLIYMHITAMLASEQKGHVSNELLDILELVHENFTLEEVYFNTLENFILTKQIRNLSPVLFKHLVEFYVHSGDGEILTEIICILDTYTLNIDETLQLCNSHGLRECSVYIWNHLLHDYMTPFVMLIEDLYDDTCDDSHKLLVFSYMSYILTGRQFPSDEFLNVDDAEESRKVICGVLFSITPIFWPKGTTNVFLQESQEAVFPYLLRFLKFNTFEMLVTLNEFFEHPCLNSDVPGELNRQYIVEALLDIFLFNKDSFVNSDYVHLSIFIARNYPKYYQFIRLLETVLHTTVERLCSNTVEDLHADCELALQSLIPFYDVESDSFLIEQVKAAKFYDVLFRMYKSEGKFASALEVWLQKQRELASMDYQRNFAVLASIIEASYSSGSENTLERSQLVQFIGDHFDELISRNTDDMVVLANSYNRDLHMMVLKCKDQEVAFKYLQLLFSRYDINDIGGSRIELVVRYIELLCVFSPELVIANVSRFAPTLVRFPEYSMALETYFQENDNISALTVILRVDGRYEEALQVVITAMKAEVAERNALKIENFVNAALSVCEEAPKGSLWKTFVEEMVKMTTGSSEEVLGVLNQGIYQCFRSITNQEDVNESRKGKEAFTTIFNDILELATVSNIRAILQEILMSYFLESEMHTTTVSKINQGIYKYMEQVKMDQLRGWLIKSQNCTSCGKPICGKNISAVNLMAWQDREQGKVFVKENNIDEQYKEAQIVFFKCRHGYHSQCLANLGSIGKCVICTSQ